MGHGFHGYVSHNQRVNSLPHFGEDSEGLLPSIPVVTVAKMEQGLLVADFLKPGDFPQHMVTLW